MTRQRKQTIVFMEFPCTDLDLVDYMYLLKTKYQGRTFIPPIYVRERAAVARVAETMLLEGIIELGVS